MKINFTTSILFFFFACFMNSPLSAQKKTEPDKSVMVEMRDGNNIMGTLKGRQGDTVTVESTTLGTLRLNIKNIKSITALDAQQLKKGVYWFDNPHATRGFFAPTGFNLRKGEGYYNNVFLFLNSAAYGFTDNFTVGVGAEVATLFSGNLPALLYITPKLSFKGGKNFTYGVGILAGSFGLNTDRATAGILYGVGTFGNRDKNFSAALGYGFANGTLAKRPVVTLSGQYRVAKKVGLMTENYILPEVQFGVTGVRLMNSNFSFDIGAMYGSITGDFGGGGGVAPFPFLGFAIPFGHKKI
jgi:hypothetical protein